MHLTHTREDGTKVRVRKKIRGDELHLTVIETAPGGESKKSEKTLAIPPPKGSPPRNKERQAFVEEAVEAAKRGAASAPQPKPAKPAEPKKEPAP